MLPTVRVRLLGVPVALCAEYERHTNDLLREIALMAAARPDLERDDLFGDLLATADTYAHRPAGVRRRIVDCATLARRAGRDSVDVEVEADEVAAEGALLWEELLRRFDGLSREDRLLTMPASPGVVAYRRWYVAELVEQVRTGRAPVAWEHARVADGAALAGAAS